jgi:hypothetical protein
VPLEPVVLLDTVIPVVAVDVLYPLKGAVDCMSLNTFVTPAEVAPLFV